MHPLFKPNKKNESPSDRWTCISTLGFGCNTPIFPALDQASFGFFVGLPNTAEAFMGGFSGKFSAPAAMAQYIEQSFNADFRGSDSPLIREPSRK